MNWENYQVRIVLSILLIGILLFAGCSNQISIQDDEELLPSVQNEEIHLIQRKSLTWFYEYLNVSTGIVKHPDKSVSLTDQLFVGHILATYILLNDTFSEVLQRNLNYIVKEYNDNSSLFNLTETSLLLSLLYKTPKETSNEALEEDLANRILSFRETEHNFSTDPLLCSSAAFALSALSDYMLHAKNTSIQLNLSMLVAFYKHHIETTPVTATNGYFIPWFTPSFVHVFFQNPSINDLYESVVVINTQLVQNQETENGSQIGRYMIPLKLRNDNISYQLYGLKSMMHAYNLSKKMNDTSLQNHFYQSLILGLIHIKNRVLDNDTNLTIPQHLTLLLTIDQAITILPETNWSYLWEPSTQTLISEKTLETSDTVWLALTIGVVFSIGLLFIVFILIKLYYKHKK